MENLFSLNLFNISASFINSFSLALFCISDKDKREEELEEGQGGLGIWGDIGVTLRALDRVDALI